MRKIFVKGDAGYAGTGFAEVVEVENDYPDELINDMVYQMALDNAQMYGYENHTCGEDCGEEDCGEEYSSDEIDYSWEDYNEAKHEGMY